MRRTILLLVVVVVLGAASPANAGPTASCGSAMSGWVLVDYVSDPYVGWEGTGLYTTWTGWVDEDKWFDWTESTPEGTYRYLAGDASTADRNGDLHVCMKLATPVPTEQPTNVSPWWFDWDIFLLDNVRGPKS